MISQTSQHDQVIMALPVRKIIVRLRMWWADIRGHHGKRWDYEPGDYYMGRNKNKKRT